MLPLLPLFLFQHRGIFPSGKQSVMDTSNTRTDFCRRAGLPPYTTTSGMEGRLQERYVQIVFPSLKQLVFNQLAPKGQVSADGTTSLYPLSLFLTPQPDTFIWL